MKWTLIMSGALLVAAAVTAAAAEPALIRESQAAAVAGAPDPVPLAAPGTLPVSIQQLREETAAAADALKLKMAESVTDAEQAAWGRQLNELYQRSSLRMFDLREAEAILQGDTAALGQIARERREYAQAMQLAEPAAHAPQDVAAKAEAEGGAQ